MSSMERTHCGGEVDAIAVVLKPGVVGSVRVVGSVVEAIGVDGAKVVLALHPFALPDPGENGPMHVHKAASRLASGGSSRQMPAPKPRPAHASMHFCVSATLSQTSSITSMHSQGPCVVDGSLTLVVEAKPVSLNVVLVAPGLAFSLSCGFSNRRRSLRHGGSGWRDR